MNNIEFIDMINQIDLGLRRLIATMRLRYPKKSFGPIDLSFYSIDRANYPKSPTDLNWEICIDGKEGDEYFTFELDNQGDMWCLDGYVSKHQDLELIESFIELERETLFDISTNVEVVLQKFEESCLKYLDKK